MLTFISNKTRTINMTTQLLQQKKIPMRIPTLKPKMISKKKEDAKADEVTQFVKPIATTMNRMFPSVDKLCDAPFIKKITGLGTKKAALLFIAENSTVYNFFASMEVKMRENSVLIKRDIEQFFQTKDVLIAISAFKVQIKQIEAEQKVLKKKQEEQAIIEENRERIIQEEKNKVIAGFLQEQAQAALKKGDEKSAKEFSAQAIKLLEQEQKDKMITESSDSGEEEDDSDSDYVDESSSSSSTSGRSNSRSSRSSSKKEDKEEKVEKVERVEKVVEKKEDEVLDLKRVIEVINATNEAGFLLVKHGNKEYKITDLVVDRVNTKLVLNIEPLNQEKPAVKVNFQ